MFQIMFAYERLEDFTFWKSMDYGGTLAPD